MREEEKRETRKERRDGKSEPRGERDEIEKSGNTGISQYGSAILVGLASSDRRSNPTLPDLDRVLKTVKKSLRMADIILRDRCQTAITAVEFNLYEIEHLD